MYIYRECFAFSELHGHYRKKKTYFKNTEISLNITDNITGNYSLS